MSNFARSDNSTCGFARIAMYEIQYYQDHGLQHRPLEAAMSFKSRIFQWQLLQFQTLFIDCSPMFNIPYDTFRKELPKIDEIMVKLRKRYSQNKKELIEGLSPKVWKSQEKNKHTYSNCMGCQNDPKLKKLMDLFPTKKTGCIRQNKIISAPKKNNSSTEILKYLTELPSHKKELKEVTKEVLTEANNKIQKTFPGLDIADAAKAVPEFHLEKKKSKVEKQRIKRKIYKACKENIESQRMETAVERTYGTDVSLQKRQKIRLSESFETYAQCKNRNLKTNKNMKSHIGTVSWDSNGCLKEVESYGPGISNINFSALARKYGMKTSAGNFP